MKKNYLIALICCVAIQMPSFAVPEIAPNVIPQAGVINTHDIETLRKHQIEKQVQEDFQNYKKRKKDGNIKPEPQKKIKTKVIKAKTEEYATKGV